MTYPNSSDVSAGQPTASAHYNNLRKDALYYGQASADCLLPGVFHARFVDNLTIEYLATNRLRVPYVSYKPVSMMISGCMLKATADVDLTAGLFSGGAATWYIFAVRSTGSTTFTLAVNTSPIEAADQRLIGDVYFDGTNIGAPTCYFAFTGLPDADYDSGWFACAYNNTYTKAHSLSAVPRLVMVFHNSASDGSNESVLLVTVKDGTALLYGAVGLDATNVYVKSGSDAVIGTIASTRRAAANGYYRILAWR